MTSQLKRTHVGNKRSNTLMIGGRPLDGGSAQIFLECSAYGCDEDIAILPNSDVADRNGLMDRISNNEVAKVFQKHGWSIKGYNGANHTLCPKCQKS